MPNLPVLSGLLLVLGSAFVSGLLVNKLNQPIMFGYLLGGLAVSGLLGRFGLQRETVSLLAEIGLALLMFTLGLEFSLKKIEKIKKVVIGGATLQILLTIFLGTVLFNYLWGMNLRTAFIMAASFSLSSTAIVVKLLQERGQLESLPGEIMVGWLLIQDLAVLPLIGLLPIFFSPVGFGTNLLAMAKAILVLCLTWFSAQKIVPFLTNLVVSFKNRELLLIFVVTLVFLFALITSGFGFSFALGAFLAGLVLSQTHANHAIFSEIRPLRDVFLAIFFVSLGLSLQLGFILSHGGEILLISFLVLTLKIFLIGLLLVYFRYHAKTIFAAAFGLSQVGEFSFVLATMAFSSRFLSLADYSVIVSVTLLTMVLTPWLFWLGEKFYQKSGRLAKKFPSIQRCLFTRFDKDLPLEELPFTDHVVILGYGRVGKWVGNILEKVKIPYLVVEYNPHLVRQLQLEEKKVVFGDPTDLAVLDFAQVDKARMVVLAIPDSLSQKMVIANCQTLNPHLKIICRSHLEEDFRELKLLGVGDIIQPEFEAALSMSHRILQTFGFSRDEVHERIKEIKKEHEKKY